MRERAEGPQGRPADRAHARESLRGRMRPPAPEANDMVGLGRLERPTSPLSGVRSNHLSYKPEDEDRPAEARPPSRGVRERRETKTAASRQGGLTDPVCFFRASRRFGPHEAVA